MTLLHDFYLIIKERGITHRLENYKFKHIIFLILFLQSLFNNIFILYLNLKIQFLCIVSLHIKILMC